RESRVLGDMAVHGVRRPPRVPGWRGRARHDARLTARGRLVQWVGGRAEDGGVEEAPRLAIEVERGIAAGEPAPRGFDELPGRPLVLAQGQPRRVRVGPLGARAGGVVAAAGTGE